MFHRQASNHADNIPVFRVYALRVFRVSRGTDSMTPRYFMFMSLDIISNFFRSVLVQEPNRTSGNGTPSRG